VRDRQLSDLNFQGVCHGCLFPLRTPHQELSLGLEVMTIGDTPHDQGCGILQDIPFRKDLPPLSHHSGRYLYQGCDRPVVYHRIRSCSSPYIQDLLVRYRQLNEMNLQGVCHGRLFPLHTLHQELLTGLVSMLIEDTLHDQKYRILEDIPFRKDLPPLSYRNGRYLHHRCDRPIVYHRIRSCSSPYRQDHFCR